MLWIIIFSWIVLGVFVYGLQMAYYQNEYPSIAKETYKEDVMWGIMYFIFAPVSFIVIMIDGGFKYGIQFKQGVKKYAHKKT